MSTLTVILPTYRAETWLSQLLDALAAQTLPHDLLVLDTESSDGTRQLLTQRGVRFESVAPHDFSHGGTRNLGLSLTNSAYVLYLTQDALPASPDTLAQLVAALEQNPNAAIAYGRQLPRPDATPISQFARLANYPAQSSLKTIADAPRLGIKTCSNSNSFALYRRADLLRIGGFPTESLMLEDVVVAARLLRQGLSVVYCAEAAVFHSHNYSVWAELSRYFDIGVSHRQEQDTLQPFLKTGSSGWAFAVAESQFLCQNGYLTVLPEQLLRTGLKFVGYQLGRNYQYLPTRICRLLTMHPHFW